MVTIMSWRDAGGERGSCDAKCHTAQHPKCVCMCGGRFHGAANRPGGLEKAIKDFWEDIVSDAKEKCKKEGFVLEVEKYRKERGQLSLF